MFAAAECGHSSRPHYGFLRALPYPGQLFSLVPPRVLPLLIKGKSRWGVLSLWHHTIRAPVASPGAAQLHDVAATLFGALEDAAGAKAKGKGKGNGGEEVEERVRALVGIHCTIHGISRTEGRPRFVLSRC